MNQEPTAVPEWFPKDEAELSLVKAAAKSAGYTEGVLHERVRLNQFFADRAEYDYDVETDCTIISDRVYHRAFNPDGCGADGLNGRNLCTDCAKLTKK